MRWLHGPEFLYQEEGNWPCEPSVMSMNDCDFEVQKFIGASNVLSITVTLSQSYYSTIQAGIS